MFSLSNPKENHEEKLTRVAHQSFMPKPIKTRKIKRLLKLRRLTSVLSVVDKIKNLPMKMAQRAQSCSHRWLAVPLRTPFSNSHHLSLTDTIFLDARL